MTKAPTVNKTVEELAPDPASTEVQSQPTPAPRTGNERSLTFGEKAVGLTFNPSGDPVVHEIKNLYAQIIDICHAQREQVNRGRITGAVPVEAARLWSIAITEAQGAQMWGVKAATWKD
jgi:hypothetical protein